MGKDGVWWVVCPNSNCRHPNGKHLSWRPIAKGPDNCKFCGAAFRIDASLAKQVGSGERQSHKTGKGGDDAQWLQRSSKGRIRQATSDKPKKVEIDEKAISDFLRQKCQGDSDKLQVVEQAMLTVCPPEPKSDAELYAEANGLVEKAIAVRQHQLKVSEDMQAKYRRDCTALVEYKVKLDEQLQKLEEANAQLQEARDKLLDAQAKRLNTADGSTGSSHRNGHAEAAVDAFKAALVMPTVQTMDISRSISKVGVVQNKLSAAEATSLQSEVSDILSQIQLGLQTAVLNAATAAFRVALPPTPPPPSAGAVGTAGSGNVQSGVQAYDPNDERANLLHPNNDDDELGLLELDMEARDSVKREDWDTQTGRAIRRRLPEKQVGSKPVSQQLAPDKIEEVCAQALIQAKALHQADVQDEAHSHAAPAPATGSHG